MSLTSDTMTPADIAAVTGNNNGYGFGGAGAFLYAMLFLFMFFFMGFGRGGYGAGAGPTPYQTASVTQSDMQRGFDQQSVMGTLNGINGTMNQGFANAEVSRCNQTASFVQALSELGYHQQSQADALQRSIDDTKYTIATEGCADRNALSQAVQNLEISFSGKTQAILDKLCQQEIERKNDEINQLRQRLNLAELTASQGQQTANVNGNTNAAVQSAIQALKTPAPIPAYYVPNPYGCNCGYGNYGGCCNA